MSYKNIVKRVQTYEADQPAKNNDYFRVSVLPGYPNNTCFCFPISSDCLGLHLPPRQQVLQHSVPLLVLVACDLATCGL